MIRRLMSTVIIAVVAAAVLNVLGIWPEVYAAARTGITAGIEGLRSEQVQDALREGAENAGIEPPDIDVPDLTIPDVGELAKGAVEKVTGPARYAAASAKVDTLTVKGRAPKTGYSRDQFGAAWTDVDRNGCDTRNDILRRDLVDVTFKDAGACVLATGVLHDPYTGMDISWTRGQTTSSAVQIDHLVPLSDAWQKGAQSWDKATRTAFANDPINLRAADGPANASKGDGDVATWLPPNKAFRCPYVAEVVNVKATYGLWVTQAERDAMKSVLSACAR